MKFDKHEIQCQIRVQGMTGSAACCDGKVGPLWERMLEMAEGRKIISWTFWVTLRRGPIKITAHGDMTYADVERRAERILIAAEVAFEAEHGVGSLAA